MPVFRNRRNEWVCNMAEIIVSRVRDCCFEHCNSKSRFVGSEVEIEMVLFAQKLFTCGCMNLTSVTFEGWFSIVFCMF